MRTDTLWYSTLYIAVFALSVVRPGSALPADSLIDISTIPSHLLKDSDAIIRYHEIDLRIDDRRRASETVRMVVTILNPQGRSFGELSVWYDQFRTLRSFRGELYDAEGNRVKRLRRGDIQDYSMISGISLYDDNRVQYAELYHNRYPYTVYFEYEIRHNGYINFPDWIIERRRTAVENTVFRARIPVGLELRYRNVKYDGNPLITTERNQTVYSWTAHHIAAFEEEPYGPNIQDQVMSVRIAPTEFEIEGYRGDLSSWKSFGRWYGTLSEGRDKLPEAARRDVERIAGQSQSTYELVRNLFEYMQSRTRYVSVQLGIGGWQPYDATFVHERGYGDCKALTNYMMALLSAAGIESYPVLIYSGSPPLSLYDDFPMNQFNHLILSVTVDDDTVWLECTSQTIPFGHIGRSNEGRKALLITPDGGVVIQTPTSRSVENCQRRKAVVHIRPNGAILAEIKEVYTGLQQDRVRRGIVNRSPRDRLEWMRRNIDLPSFDLPMVDYSGAEGRSPEIRLEYNVDAPRYASRMGTRLLFPANFLERRTSVPAPVEKRMHDIHIAYAYHDVDSIAFLIPDDFAIEAKPERVEIVTEFALYRAYVDDSNDGRVLYYRELEMKKSVIPAESYEEYRDFIREIVRADRAQIVLVRQ